MDESSGIGNVLRDIARAYEDGLSTIGGAISDLGKRRIPDAERQIERWIGVARAAKDGYVAAVDQAFASWERQVRKVLAPPRSQSESAGRAGSKGPASQLESWIEEWRKANESFAQSLRESGLGKEALKQAKEYRKTFEDGLKNLQKMWESATKTNWK
jgi:hypothetical protein